MPSPCTVTGNLLQLSNGIIANGQVIFELANIGSGNPITITGTGIFPALKYVSTSQANGSFALNLWGNDNISPANTIYNVTYRDNLGNEVGPIQYSITGSSVNLNSAASVSSTSPPVLASGLIVLGFGTQALGTATVNANSANTIATISVPSCLVTDQVLLDTIGDASAVSGYGPSGGGLQIYRNITNPGGGSFTIKVANPTASNITPGSLSVQWTVVGHRP